MSKDVFLCDKEVAALLRISTSTLSRILSGYHRDGIRICQGKKIDLAKASPCVVGGFRRWPVVRLADALEMTEEQIFEALGL